MASSITPEARPPELRTETGASTPGTRRASPARTSEGAGYAQQAAALAPVQRREADRRGANPRAERSVSRYDLSHVTGEKEPDGSAASGGSPGVAAPVQRRAVQRITDQALTGRADRAAEGASSAPAPATRPAATPTGDAATGAGGTRSSGPAEVTADAGRTTAGAARVPPTSEAAPGTGGGAARGPAADHAGGLTVALAVAPTLANRAAAEENMARYDDQAQRREAISRIDAALWGPVTHSWASAHGEQMDAWALELHRDGGPHQWSGTPAAGRDALFRQIVDRHRAEIRSAIVTDRAVWERLNRHTVSQGHEFVGQAQIFARAHGAVAVEGGQLVPGRAMLYHNQGDLVSQINGVAAASAAAGRTGAGARISQVAIFTHGWRDGIAGAHGEPSLSNPEAIVRGIGGALSADVRIALFACGTADARRGGSSSEGSFADRLRDALEASGHSDAVVLGHRGTEHTVGNSNVRYLAAGDHGEASNANPLSVIAQALRDETRPVIEAAFVARHPGLRLPTRAYNQSVIYFYNRDFTFELTPEAARDPARLTREAAAWWRRFVPVNAEAIAAHAFSKLNDEERAGGGGRGHRHGHRDHRERGHGVNRRHGDHG